MKIKVGVFGAYRGIAMIRFLLKYREAELVAVCDKYLPALDKVREAADSAGMKVRLFEDFDRFLECDMDAVVLANYANEHAPYAVRCLRSGRHVLSEVMAVQTMAQAVELIEAVEETGKQYSYSENFCYFRGAFEMRRRFERGEIGEFTYGEGEYVHDCTSRWPSLTYGDRDHWRNHMFVNYYCSHSLGPVLFVTGARPKTIVGFETRPSESLRGLGALSSGGGMIICRTEQGALIKALHGGLKREPSSYWCSVYGTRGCMESDRWGDHRTHYLNTFTESPDPGRGEYRRYVPDRYIDSELSRETLTHFGADFYTGYFFFEKLLGREDGRYSIDVYRGLDMSLPGILAHRSILAGNQPVSFPDLRDPAQRERYRNDHACADPKVAGYQLVPSCSIASGDIPDEVYARTKMLWEAGLPG